MLLTVLDGLGIQQKVIVKGQESIVDYSGTLTATSASQVIAEANPTRSGYYLQNLSNDVMWFNDLGVASESAGSILVGPGASLSSKEYAVGTNSFNLIGTSESAYTLRQW